MISSHRIAVTDDSSVGEVRRYVASLCRLAALDETWAGRAAIVSTEMARNMVRHANGGEMIIWQHHEHGQPFLELMALDRGPGMGNVAHSLRDGHSTGGTAGTGLGAIKRQSTHFDVHSLPDQGTVVWSRLFDARLPFSGPAANRGFEFGAVSVAIEGEEVCGDAWHVLPSPNEDLLRVLLVDGLGHGPIAEVAAREAVDTFTQFPNAGPAAVLENIHRALMKTRGAAGSVVEITPGTQTVTGAGVGNVAMRLFDGEAYSTLISDNGTLGANVRRMRQVTQPWKPSSLLIMHSDGLATQWTLANYPGLAYRHPSLIAAVLYRDFRRQRDDATVVVVRYRP